MVEAKPTGQNQPYHKWLKRLSRLHLKKSEKNFYNKSMNSEKPTSILTFQCCLPDALHLTKYVYSPDNKLIYLALYLTQSVCFSIYLIQISSEVDHLS